MQCQQEYYVGISIKISTNVLFQFDEFTEKGDKNPLTSREKNEWSYPDYILSHFKYNIFYSEEKEIKIKSLKITQLWRYSAPLNLF